MSGDELKIPLRIDVSQVASDLRAVDTELARLERRVVQMFNRQVANPGTGRATGIGDVRAFLGQSGPLQQATLQAAPEFARAVRALEQREAALARQAQAGLGRLPPTERQAALGRLAQVERQTRPLEVTARAEFFDRMRQSLQKGLPNYAAMAAAQGNIPGAASAARLLMGLVADNPILAALVGGGAAVAGGALAINAQQAQFQRTQASLASALVGGPAFGSTRTLLGLNVMQAAQGIDTGAEQGNAIAQQLALGGMGRGNLLGNLSNVLMTALPAGMKPSDVTPLVSALGTAGGMSAADINKVLQQVVGVAGDATGSLAELLGGMKALSGSAVGAAKDVMSLAAIQHLVGPTSGIQAGALMSGVMGATGAQALQSAALLGMSPAAFLQAQGSKGGMAQIWDRIGAFARRLPSGAAGTMVTEQLLSQTGLLTMQNLSARQQANLVQTLRTQGPQAAERLAAHYTATTRTVSQAQSYVNAARAADNLTSALDRSTMALSNWWTGVINGGGSPLPPPVRRPGWQSRYSGRATIGVQQINAALTGGMAVSTGRPGQGPAHASASIVGQAWAAANGDPQLFAMMMATMAHESGFQAGAIGKGPHAGYGIAQFTDTLGAAGLRRYLGPGDWRTAALTPNQAIRGLAAYDVDLLAGAHGDVQLAEARYNAGPGAGRNTLYGQQVYGATQGTEHELHITIVVKDDRNTTLAHKVDHHRVVPGYTRHGPPPPRPPGRHR